MRLRLMVSGALALILAVSLSYVTSLSSLVEALSRLSLASVVVIGLLLASTLLLAAWRLRMVAADLGHALSFRDCLAATAIGNAAGHVAFQWAGHLAARSAVLGRTGVGVETAIAATLYERIVALAVAGLIGIGGAIVVFGRVGLDLRAGGAELLTIVLGIAVTFAVVAATAWRDLIMRHVLPLITAKAAARLVRLLILTVSIHAITLAAFVLSARQVAPSLHVIDLTAASAVVMFATAIPVSFAGWGVRELSSVAALGAIGVAPESAVVSAVAMGVVSFVVVAAIAGLSPLFMSRSEPHAQQANVTTVHQEVSVAAIAWTLPLLTALLVFFQFHVPLAQGKVNISPADLLAIIGGSLLTLQLATGRTALIRVPGLIPLVLAGTAVIIGGYLHGLAAFGSNAWAATKLTGWFILLGYAATGALIVNFAGREGMRSLIWTAVVSAATITAINLVFQGQHSRFVGFAADPNAFSFQLVMMSAAGLALLRGCRTWPFVQAVLIAGIWFAGSRSGALAFGLVLCATLVLRPKSTGPIVIATAVAAVLVIARGPVLELVQFALPSGLTAVQLPLGFMFEPRSWSDSDRWRSIALGLEIFRDSPVLGAGLGYFTGHFTRPNGESYIIHSSPLWLLAEFGLVGFAVIGAAFLRILSVEIPRAWRGDDAALMFVLAALGLAAVGLAQDILYQRTFWLVAGAALAAPIVVGSRTSKG